VRIAALGRTKALYETIHALLAAGHEIPLIATCAAAPEYAVRENDFMNLAAEIDAVCVQSGSLNSPSILKQLQRASCEIAVSVNWLTVIGAEPIAAFPRGILNAHAGDLPRYRGNAPVAWAILQGEPHIGLTIHQMEASRLDSGPILLKELLPLNSSSYVGQLLSEIDSLIPSMFLRAVEGLSAGTLIPTPQDERMALRGYPRQPSDGLLEWSRSAEYLGRLVRASAEPFAGAFTYYNAKRLTVWRAGPMAWDHQALAVPGQVISRDRSSGTVHVACGDQVLALSEVEYEGVRTAPAELIQSTRDRIGT
jgi:UDP-4-amino-4-deoxy-L-arabinose formyltransferase/UDP-glucuronic acid dehydrogenase (UDP-4-keto-hexauronic acid decarboxylating)